MKLVSVVGTRPNFSKELLINKLLKKKGIEEILIHTGQHYSYELSEIFFKQLGLPDPDYSLTISKNNSIKQTSEMLFEISEILRKEQPDVTLVYGDVNSTLAGAIASSMLSIPVAHVEAGVRGRLYNPEEINRRVADTLSNMLFAPSRESYRNLIKENFPEKNTFFTGDVMLDTMFYIMKKFGIKKKKGKYHVATVHRAENSDSEKNLTKIIEGFMQSEKEIIFPIHPRTQKNLEKFRLMEKIQGSNITLKKPLGYIEFLKLMAGSDKIITDSGGVRREAYFLGKPCITLIDIIWFPEIVEAGWNFVAGTDKEKIIYALSSFNPTGSRPPIFGNGNASEKIVNTLSNRYEK